MRIVGGRHRGRRIAPPVGRDVRPTSDRTRESLFNILAHGGWGMGGASPLVDAVVLDAFCGTGALGLEALSRGAAQAVLLDRNRASLDLARSNAGQLGEAAACRFLLADALKPPPAAAPADILFLDPPYGQDLAPRALAALAGAGWVRPGTLACVEVGDRDPFAPPAGFEPLDDRAYSHARLLFLRAG
ncbi:RsmD family RNA methyltransferase [Rhodospirillum centenum]|uniref:Methyltransferase, putative n=1 Tax=Rhodospirillum centenum (strain ATCC 51521 / SW) TaxID=414684 RepID=B6IXC4_RHOCS|nr:RsmD family RNA methyltransferase [Rhodospirillum centenum]ACJ00948.1 methyltransferase, putative [Rhodospirillum centenum SW]